MTENGWEWSKVMGGVRWITRSEERAEYRGIVKGKVNGQRVSKVSL